MNRPGEPIPILVWKSLMRWNMYRDDSFSKDLPDISSQKTWTHRKSKNYDHEWELVT